MAVRAAVTLEIGEVFAHDLLGPSGLVVLPAGQPVDSDLLLELNEQDCGEVHYQLEPREIDPAQLKPYDARELLSLQCLFEDVPCVIDAVAETLAEGNLADARDIDSAMATCLEAIQHDAAAVLATALQQPVSASTSTSARSLRMSTVAMVAAHSMGFSSSDCKAVGRAGLLHDISLPKDRRDLVARLQQPDTSDFELISYRMHPLKSGDRLRTGLIGMSELELVLIAQVHEQCDGSGFPRGLKKHQLHPLSRLLNIVDAFLTLVDPQDAQDGFVAADALAYLIQHMLYGSFDHDCVQALIAAWAVYPVGSKVLLSDHTLGTVMRSNGKNYLQPVIRLDDGTQRFVDLRHESSQIAAPIPGPQRRLPKSRFDEVLWMACN